MSEKQILNQMETLFLALGDKTRLRLLNLMRKDEVCVYLFTDILGESQPKISRHLAYLRNAGIVESRRDGKMIYYRIALPNEKSAAFILNDILDWLGDQTQMQAEYDKLMQQRPGKKNIDSEISEKDYSPEPEICVKPHTAQEKEELAIFLL